MARKCTKCNIVWSDKTLTDNCPQKGWEEESMEVCPCCLSDMDLEYSEDSNTFSFSYWTGVITNDKTGEAVKRPLTPFEKKTITKVRAWKESDVNGFYATAERKFTVADGTTCLCCDSKLPKHSNRCVLATYNKELNATIVS